MVTERLPAPHALSMDDPATAERAAAIVGRVCKLQDRLAGAVATPTPCAVNAAATS